MQQCPFPGNGGSSSPVQPREDWGSQHELHSRAGTAALHTHPLENNNKLICKGCRPLLLYSLNIWNILHMFMKGMPAPFVSNPQQIHFPRAAPEPGSGCRFVFTVTQGNTPRQNQTEIHFKLLEFLPPFNSQQLQPTKSLNYHQIFFLMSGTIVMISIRQK